MKTRSWGQSQIHHIITRSRSHEEVVREILYGSMLQLLLGQRRSTSLLNQDGDPP